MSYNSITFEANGLYILVSDIGEELQFHWGLYLAQGPAQGQVFHLINNRDTGHQWRYQSKVSANVSVSKTLIVALKIAVMDPALHGALADRLPAVSTTPPISCLQWLRRALDDLDNEGYIKLKATIDEIELEALDEAAKNKPRNLRTTIKSRGSMA